VIPLSGEGEEPSRGGRGGVSFFGREQEGESDRRKDSCRLGEGGGGVKGRGFLREEREALAEH